ncbi:Uroporphyrin-III C/tetrapyrrole (Corrin/Porphyrin) methyltransferase [Kineococcus radiotolerans SRS30216 = ATCC BAA-149]|uniref:uroporphyrinogen-III C-methyltransferase n=2 Tax=Kineococcus radiotolerans TaxID=131568 RepID=A6W5L9_KINRD|nr:Uroporphyrin-III C/tetrapyrrole (Corrin/Porphyrin) methyltransferase [Kineococcus radiotolerans SRS30216 = ATCC BAA-149]
MSTMTNSPLVAGAAQAPEATLEVTTGTPVAPQAPEVSVLTEVTVAEEGRDAVPEQAGAKRSGRSGKSLRSPGSERTAKAGKTLGHVSFVGAGPGDPGLLTVRAVDLLAAADVVVLDQTSREDLPARYGRDGVEVLDAGFGDDGQPLTRAARAKLVVKAAKAGGHVVRLMDGDASTFTGLADEIAACRKAGVSFDVVPGVSVVNAVPAYAGVPMTTGSTSSVNVVHPAGRSLDWSRHADKDATVVVLGTGDDIAAAAAGLLGAGRAASTPVAVTSHGTTTTQSTTTTTLGELEPLAAALDGSPTTAVVGDVVALREQGSWYETKPLFGWRVLVPRTKEQAGGVTAKLSDHGATAEVVPTISVEPPRTPQQMEKAVKGLVTGRYEWIGFTSVNAVRAVREKFTEYGLDARAFSGLKVAAVGGVTADALREWGIEPDLVPEGEQSASGLLEAWPPYDDVLDPINRVFLPRADIATDTLVAGLQENGWEVDDVTAYRTVRAAPPAAPVRDAIKTGAFDAVVFTSSSTVRNLVGIAGKPHPSTVVACIGPATAKTAEEHGLRVDVLAPEPSADALVDALAGFGQGLRAAAVEAGEPVLRPSQKKSSARRRAR